MSQTAADIFYSFPRVIDLGLERIQKALAMLEINLPPIIHVAGTNGKGSTLAFLRAILESAGKKCHVYTSPHLVTIHERYVVAGTQISESELLKIALQVKEIAQNIPLTIFEAETIASFIAFSETKADYLLLETGLGGRLDATNAIETKELCIITPIDYDHKEYLGDDIKQIAREKCGIMRNKVPVIVARQGENVLKTIEAEAEKLNAPLYTFGRDFDGFMSYGKFCFQTLNEFLELPNPSLAGDHQLDNASNAIMAAKLLGIENELIARGVQSAKWPARLQRLDFGWIGEIARQQNCEIWLDGGHNPHGGRALSAFIEKQNAIEEKPTILVCGFLNNKDIGGFLENFIKFNPLILPIEIETSTNSAKVQDIALIIRHLKMSTRIAGDFTQALQLATRGKNHRIIICGSLYLAGEILAKNKVRPH